MNNSFDFKFNVGDDVKDKQVFNVLTIVSRFYDVDRDVAMYETMNKDRVFKVMNQVVIDLNYEIYKGV